MLDDFDSKCVAYSFGISNDVSWDDDMADRGFEIFMYDHTIEGLPHQRAQFHFYPYGIAETKQAKLDTLENFINHNGHTHHKHMVLKMDVEGAEWTVLQQMDKTVLSCFDQMVFELHRIEDMACMIRVLEKLNESYQVVHVHANNYCSPTWDDERAWPYAFEVTYANRNRYTFEEPKELCLPIDIDRPCNPNMPELSLGQWNT